MKHLSIDKCFTERIYKKVFAVKMGALNSVGAKVRKSNVHRSIKIGLGWVRLTKNLDQNRLVREEVRFAIKTIPPPSKKLPVAMYKISIVLCFVSFVNSQLK